MLHNFPDSVSAMGMSVAIITGASAGIGEALSRALHKRGWKVGLIARRAEALNRIVIDLGERAAFSPADVTDRESVSTAIRTLEQMLGPCDLLIANAGIGVNNPAARFDLDDAVQVFRVNIDGVLNASAAVLPAMLERGSGHIAVMSSVAGYRGLPNAGPYCASKAAVTSLYESWRVELVPKGIAVTTIHPGFIETAMTAKNKHPMPFLMNVDKAADIMARGLIKKKREVNVPWQMGTLMKVVKWLPNPVFDWALRKAATF